MNSKTEESFKIKANFLPITVIKFIHNDLQSISQQLQEVHLSAPNYFNQSPVIIDLSALKRPADGIDLSQFCQILRENQMIPVGVQGLQDQEQELAEKLGLAIWRSSAAALQQTKKKPKENVISEQTEVSTKGPHTIITKPVRSGMRIYAKKSNLILLAPVNSGAECIADGDIFCYAPVRGRLLAGASGNLNAQIFCNSLDAELIAIAGFYLLYDECPAERNGNFQISLKENKLQIDNFSLERSVSLCQK